MPELEHATYDEIVDELFKRYDQVLLLTDRQEKNSTDRDQTYSYQGNRYAILGMSRIFMHMLESALISGKTHHTKSKDEPWIDSDDDKEE